MLLQETFLNGLVDGRTSLFVITLPSLSKTKQNKTKKVLHQNVKENKRIGNPNTRHWKKGGVSSKTVAKTDIV